MRHKVDAGRPDLRFRVVGGWCRILLRLVREEGRVLACFGAGGYVSPYEKQGAGPPTLHNQGIGCLKQSSTCRLEVPNIARGRCREQPMP